MFEEELVLEDAGHDEPLVRRANLAAVPPLDSAVSIGAAPAGPPMGGGVNSSASDEDGDAGPEAGGPALAGTNGSLAGSPASRQAHLIEAGLGGGPLAEQEP